MQSQYFKANFVMLVHTWSSGRKTDILKAQQLIDLTPFKKFACKSLGSDHHLLGTHVSAVYRQGGWIVGTTLWPFIHLSKCLLLLPRQCVAAGLMLSVNFGQGCRLFREHAVTGGRSQEVHWKELPRKSFNLTQASPGRAAGGWRRAQVCMLPASPEASSRTEFKLSYSDTGLLVDVLKIFSSVQRVTMRCNK